MNRAGRVRRGAARLALALLLSACGAAPPAATLRDPVRPIWSAAALDPLRLAGTWHQRSEAAPAGAPPCAAAPLVIAAAGPGLRFAGRPCLGGRPVELAAQARPAGPGRFDLDDPAGPWWVLWIDADARTMAIGTPEGGFGLVLDRSVRGGEDRIAAAEAVLAFNGYDSARLRRLPPP
jgi:apolipoprotein D and lipocalin family protein